MCVLALRLMVRSPRGGERGAARGLVEGHPGPHRADPEERGVRGWDRSRDRTRPGAQQELSGRPLCLLLFKGTLPPSA